MNPSPYSRHHVRPKFRLLEVTIISAQDLPRAAAPRGAYAIAWVDPSHKVATTASTGGGVDPAWNEKLIFRVDDDFLRSETSAVMIDLFVERGGPFGCLRSDPLLGTVRVIISPIHPSSTMHFVALQIRRPKTLRPQGILNLGISLVPARPPYYDRKDPTAFAYRDFAARPSIHRSFTGYVAKTNGAQREIRRSGSVMAGSWEGDRERELLESKLRRWRNDLSPIYDPKEEKVEGDKARLPMIEIGDAMPTRRQQGLFSCLRGEA